DRLRSIADRHRGGSKSLATVDQNPEYHAAERSRSIIEADQSLEPPIASSQFVGKQCSALRAQPTVVRLSGETERVTLDGGVATIAARRTDIGHVLFCRHVPLREIRHR